MAIIIGGGITIGGQITVSLSGATFTVYTADISDPSELFNGYSNYTNLGFTSDGTQLYNGISYTITQGLHDQIAAASAAAGFTSPGAYVWNVSWGSGLTIATNSDGGLVGWGSQALSVAANPVILSTYPVGSTITFQDNTTATITQIDDYSPTYIDIFWDTPKTGDLFPITLSNNSLARVGLDANGSNTLAFSLIDQSDTQWQSGNTSGPTQTGTFTFPAVFTPYSPLTQLQNANNWC